jgi:hypothetical protein
MECLSSWHCQLLKCSDFSIHSLPHSDVFHKFIQHITTENCLRQKALSERFLYKVACYYEWSQIQNMGRTFEKFPSAVTVRGQVVAQLVETLRYKPEGRGVRFPMVSLDFFIYIILESTQEYLLGSKGGQCVGLKTLLPSWAECLEIWEPQPPWTRCTRPVWDVQRWLYIYIYSNSLLIHFSYIKSLIFTFVPCILI